MKLLINLRGFYKPKSKLGAQKKKTTLRFKGIRLIYLFRKFRKP